MPQPNNITSLNLAADQPLISVVVATYNGQRFLVQQLESICSQTYPHIEIIVVDDGSTDATVSIAKSMAAKDRRIRVVVNEVNLGLTKNFEKGFQLATGDFVAPCDQDDVWQPQKLETLLREMGNHDIVYSDSALIDSEGNSLGRKLSDVKSLLDFDDCLTFAIGNTAAGHAMLIRKSLLDKCYPFPANILHDYWLGFVATCYQPIHFVNESLVLYRQHTHNAFGAVKVAEGKRKKKKKTKAEKLDIIRERMRLLYEKCPAALVPQKQVYKALLDSYQSFSVSNNFKRMMLFFRHRDKLLAFKKKPPFRKWLFCVKMFYKIK